MRRSMLVTAAVALLAAGLLVVAGCGGNDNEKSSSSSSSSSSGGGGKNDTVALLLPEAKTTRYEAQDRPLFTKKFQSLCPNCKLIYSNADQDAAKQQQQAEAAITQGAKVLVLDPVDGAAAAAIVNRAKQSGVKVISYDRLILESQPDYYVEFDSAGVGKQQGQALLKALGGGSGKSIVMINGAPTDNNAKLFKEGAHSVLDSSGIKIAKQYDTPDWSPDKAQTEMSQAITAVGKNNIDGVYSANDGMAGGIVAAMKGGGLDSAKVPVTGQDAQVDGIQRILADQQYMTVYKPIKPLAENAATIAAALAQGKAAPSNVINDKVNNGTADIPTVRLDTVPVTKDNVKDTVFKDGFVTPSQVCTGEYASACKAAGIS
jgi:D-xylose transport system substrate-binding protein